MNQSLPGSNLFKPSKPGDFRVLRAFASLFLEGSVEYSGCHYEDGEEIAGKGGTWEASMESVQADKVKDGKLPKTLKVVKHRRSKKTKVKVRGSKSEKKKKKIAAKY